MCVCVQALNPLLRLHVAVVGALPQFLGSPGERVEVPVYVFTVVLRTHSCRFC